ncbi:MAG TPA: SLATT domain-containing protein [Sphingomicrobium sp.]|nr:SLATT domain-containing protein [Sphingomicrobium sp.]
MADPTAPIWLTYKSRMNAERRLHRYGVVAHLAISWYSFLLIVFGIFQSKINIATGTDVSPLAIVLSVLVFGLSLIFYGFRFEERAAKYRDCYLTLQRLYRSGAAVSKKMREYTTLLERYPNHSETDFEQVVFESWRRATSIENAEGPIFVTKSLILKGYARMVSWWLLLVIAFGGPLAAAAWLM